VNYLCMFVHALILFFEIDDYSVLVLLVLGFFKCFVDMKHLMSFIYLFIYLFIYFSFL
jgi:hypothetical protein